MAVSNIAFSLVSPSGSFGGTADVILTDFIATEWIINLQAAGDATDAVVAFSFDGTNVHGQLNLAKVCTMTVHYLEKKLWLKKVSGASTVAVAVTALGPIGKV